MFYNNWCSQLFISVIFLKLSFSCFCDILFNFWAIRNIKISFICLYTWLLNVVCHIWKKPREFKNIFKYPHIYYLHWIFFVSMVLCTIIKVLYNASYYIIYYNNFQLSFLENIVPLYPKKILWVFIE
jgi:hypothetical protein